MTMEKRTFTLEQDQIKKLNEHSQKTGLKMSTIVRMGLNLFFIREFKKEQNGIDKETPT